MTRHRYEQRPENVRLLEQARTMLTQLIVQAAQTIAALDNPCATMDWRTEAIAERAFEAVAAIESLEIAHSNVPDAQKTARRLQVLVKQADRFAETLVQQTAAARDAETTEETAEE